jgi:dTDP-glucose 4,6-dehydratase
MKSVVITGCGGFIGGYVAREFLDAGYKVMGIDKKTYAHNPETIADLCKNPNFEFHPSCITMGTATELFIRQHPVEWIINLAAETHVDNSIQDCVPFIKTNINGVQQCLEVCRNTGCKLLQFSTDEVYGVAGDYSFTEESPLDARNPYSATKAAADHLIQAYANTYGVEYIIVRPSNNFGVGQHEEKFLPTILRKLDTPPEKIPVYGKGDQIREWTHARDTAAATRFILENSPVNEIYNISSGFHTENIKVVETVCKSLGLNVEDVVEYVADRLGHDFKYSVSADKLKALGFEIESRFQDDIEEIIDHEFDRVRHSS